MDLLRISARVASSFVAAAPDWGVVESALLDSLAGLDASAEGSLSLIGPWSVHGLGVRVTVFNGSLFVIVLGPDGAEDPIWEGAASEWDEESQGEAAHEAMAAMAGFVGD